LDFILWLPFYLGSYKSSIQIIKTNNMIVWIFAIVVLAVVGKLVYDVQQKKNKPTQTEHGFDKEVFQKLAGIKPTNPNDELRQIIVKNNIFAKEQIVEALLKAAENSEFPKQDETINVRTTKITTIDTNFGSDNDPLASVPMSRVSTEAKQKMAEIAKEDIVKQLEENSDKFATLTNQTKCGCGRSETGFCTGLHRIPKKAWAEGVRDIPAEKPKRKYTKKQNA
jgi:predicted negative regulator of RcsB-dependent stress response